MGKFEKPEGWSVGQPEVLLAENVIDRHGMAAVNYESLHRFLAEDLAIPRADKQVIKIYGRDISRVRGWMVPFSRTSHVNAFHSESMSSPSTGSMGVVAHEGKHISDVHNRKARVVAEKALNVSATVAGAWLSGEYIADFFPVMLIGGLATGEFYYSIDPFEKRARKQSRKMAGSPHETDILFPQSARTMRLSLQGRVPQELMEGLGIDHEAGNFAFSWPNNPPDGLRYRLERISKGEAAVNQVALNGETVYVKPEEQA